MTSSRPISLAVATVLTCLASNGPGSANEAGKANMQPGRIVIEYVPPKSDSLRQLYEMTKDCVVLESMQKIFAPFRLPANITLKTEECGHVNAWYNGDMKQPTITICYEYLKEILDTLPMETTRTGVTRVDALAGQTFYVVAHELGHAFFHLYDVPIFGREEDAADQFAAYVMLQFDNDPARSLIGGASHAYARFIEGYREKPRTLPLEAFSSTHGLPWERFYNLLCMAYGAGPTVFADLVEKDQLPQTRAKNCRYEYGRFAHAFRKEIMPHIDWPEAEQVFAMDWFGALMAPLPTPPTSMR